MDRSPPETEGVLTAKPNGRRNTVQPFGNRRPSRKSSGNPESKENSITSDVDVAARTIPRPTYRQSDSLIARSSVSPSPSSRVDRSTTIFGTPRHSRDTRIPRPKTTVPVTNKHPQDITRKQDQSPESPMRQPMSLNAAFKRAQEQTAAEANSDSDNTVDLRQAFNMANAEFNDIQGIDGSPSPAPRSFRRELYNTAPSKNGVGRKDNDLNKHLQQFDRNHQLASDGGPLNGLFRKNHVGSKVSETGRALAKKVSDSSLGSSLGGSPERQRPDVRTASPKKQENIKLDRTSAGRVPVVGTHTGGVDADIPVPSIEYEFASGDQPSPDFQPANLSPEKSMNWHLDADFTAGDLQFSASPRVTIGKPRSDSRNKSDDGHAPNSTPAYRRSNDRLSQIQKREAEAARTTFPEDTSASKQMNHKLDEIRAREMEALSRRAVASSRLDEIRIRNSEPRSESPETRKDPEMKSSTEESAGFKAELRDALKHYPDLESRGEPIHDTPVVVFRNLSDRTLEDGNQDRGKQNEDKREALSRSDSHDLLRRLARATSSSPGEQSGRTEQAKTAPSPEKPIIKQLSEACNLNRSPLPQEERRARNLEVKNSRDRLTVGFADLMRIPSSDSIQEKRTSKPTSEVDPTDRIEAELNLFAPMDNYSEKGSIRAPSPIPSEPIDEETPRPVKINPLTQPTPRVTGAYVDTPATVRVKGKEADFETTDIPALAPEVVPTAQSRNPSLSPTKRFMNPSATGRAKSLRRLGPRSSSVPTASRRGKSSSRRQRPLTNTARPPTVREDILAILRANDIDDSTLENLDSILADREVDDHDLKQMVNDSVLKVEDDLDMKFSEMTDRERELEAYDRMSKSLKTGLLGIRSAKKGIERLEDKVIHNDRKDERLHPGTVPSTKPVPQSSRSPDEAAPVLIPVPRLFRKDPKFKLTRFGTFAICAIIWYALELAFCFLYAGPEYACTPNIPCDWSPNEPYFPYTMPFMLDEWATGGKGRAFAWWVGEEVGDAWADVSDWATNTDFTLSDQRYMDVWQRKRHIRRLRKHELIPKWTAPPGYKARYPEWQAAKAAKDAAQDLGLDEEDETMSADEIVR
ncbi:hypothetical protein HD806DRAFT_179865 [Xylariaceae sp. AK1471]|nr:hypothetical protein HD806DRAFT_179865 [Xylariaceae sp. AK1471]